MRDREGSCQGDDTLEGFDSGRSPGSGALPDFPGFPVAVARGKHPFPFRTRQLSLAAPMVLHRRRCGRVGRRRDPAGPRWVHAHRGPFSFRRTGGLSASRASEVEGFGFASRWLQQPVTEVALHSSGQASGPGIVPSGCSMTRTRRWGACGAERATRAQLLGRPGSRDCGRPDRLPCGALPSGRLATLGGTRTSAAGC